MKTYYVVFEDLETSDEQGVFVYAPTESVAIKSLGPGVVVIEILEFDEDEATEFNVELTGGLYYDEEYGELDFED